MQARVCWERRLAPISWTGAATCGWTAGAISVWHNSEQRNSGDVILTVDAELDRLADGGRHPVVGDAHVGAHLTAGHLVQVDGLPLHPLLLHLVVPPPHGDHLPPRPPPGYARPDTSVEYGSMFSPAWRA